MTSGPVVIFRTHSDIEASIVRGLLEAHGIPVLISSGLTRSVFPVSVSGAGELRVAVSEMDEAEARRLIETHREEMTGGRVVPLRDEFRGLEDRIGYRFRDPGLLEHALTHRSRVHEDASGGVFDNESLEFLGDAVLGFVIADLLFREFPQHNEGEKSKIKASIVSAPSLGRLAERIGLGEFLILGRGEEKSGGRRKMALVSDSYEALIAAIYMDGGVQAARAFIEREFGGLIEDAKQRGAAAAFTMDFKSALQEWLQAAERPLPAYRLTGTTGPDHRKQFQVAVIVGGEALAEAVGPSKKEAEQEAARMALAKLRQ
jgi:ribonuclease-3